MRDDDCAGCGYCGLEFGRMTHEHDHAPVPRACGGEQTIPVCGTCHDLKDRVPFGYWPPKMLADSIRELIGLGLMAPTIPAPTALPDAWDGMSRGARLAWAKVARLTHDSEVKAAREGTTLTAVIVAALEDYVEGDGDE